MRNIQRKEEDKVLAGQEIHISLASENAAFCESFLQYFVQQDDPALRLVTVYAADVAAAHFRFIGEETCVKPLSAESMVNELLRTKNTVLLLDVDLPGIDSLSIIQRLHHYGLSERVVVISEFLSSLHKSAFSAIPIGYYMRLPVSPSVLCKRILECGQSFFLNKVPAADLPDEDTFLVMDSGGKDLSPGGIEDKNILLKRRTTQLLHEIGIPANLCGHEYLREAIMMIAGDCEVYGKMTKVIYPAIAKKYAKSCSSVEKAIRTALDIAWVRGKTELLNYIFGFTVNVQKGKPTNSEFIALMADYLRSESFHGGAGA